MTWYITIILWAFGIGITFYILKELVPKSFWSWCETKIIEWQCRSTTQTYEVTSNPKKMNKLYFMIICLVLAAIAWCYVNWWMGILTFIFTYFIIGVILMQRGVIANN